MIPQGSNNPLVIQFDENVEHIPRLVVTLWSDMAGRSKTPLKVWENADMTVTGDTAVCPLTEQETREFPLPTVVLEVKGLDSYGYTIFWEEYKLDIMRRRDKIITLTQVNNGGVIGG